MDGSVQDGRAFGGDVVLAEPLDSFHHAHHRPGYESVVGNEASAGGERDLYLRPERSGHKYQDSVYRADVCDRQFDERQQMAVLECDPREMARRRIERNRNERRGSSDAGVLGLSLIHISEPTRRTPISYAVFCLKKK